jgi:hypothetical protein
LQSPFIAAVLGQSGAGGMSKPLNASFAQPQGVFEQRLQVLPLANFSTTFPLTLPIRYPNTKISNTPNPRNRGVTFKPEAILFSVGVFMPGIQKMK